MPRTLDEEGARRLIEMIRLQGGKPGPGKWISQGRCAEVDPELWFPGKWDSDTAAKKICARCEVRLQCLEYAVETDEQHGVWGGLNRSERIRLRKAMDHDADGGQPGAA